MTDEAPTTGPQRIPPRPTPPLRTRVLETANSTINGQRAQDYGEATKSFERVADIWSAILGTNVTPVQVALCMVGLKVSRAITTEDHADSYVDIAGYAALAAELGGVKL